MIKIIHAADVHLDSPLCGLERYEGAPVEEIRGATRRALNNLVQLALDESVDLVLLAGDLYDGDWKDYHTGLYLISLMVKLREAEIPVCIVKGNHDAASQITSTLRLPENVYVFSHRKPASKPFNELGIVVHGQSFARPAVTDNLAANYPTPVPDYFNIGLLHTSADGRPGHEPYAPCSLEGLRNHGYDYWALGHVHKREVLNEQPWVVFSGNIQGRHIRETGPKGCQIITIKDDAVAVDFHPLDVLRWSHLIMDCEGIKDGYDILGRVEDNLNDELARNPDLFLAMRIELQGACPAHNDLTNQPEQWQNEIRALATDAAGGRVWIEKILLNTTTHLDIEKVRAGGGPVGDLLNYIDQIDNWDDDAILTLSADLEALWQKLPADFKQDDETRALRDPRQLRRWIAEIPQLLVPQLLQMEEQS